MNCHIKIIKLLLFAIIMFGMVSCKTGIVEDAMVEGPADVTLFQQYMLDEINLARTDPATYADLRLKTDYDNSADNGSYLFLKNSVAVGAITFNSCLNESASNYAIFLAEKNLAEHNADGTPLKRAIRAGFTGSSTGENIAIASENIFNANVNPQSAAIGFVRILLIDKGVEDIGHRLILMNSKYTFVGIGFTRNSTSTVLNYLVQDFGKL